MPVTCLSLISQTILNISMISTYQRLPIPIDIRAESLATCAKRSTHLMTFPRHIPIARHRSGSIGLLGILRAGLGVTVVIHFAEKDSRLELIAVREVDAFAGGSRCSVGDREHARASGKGEEELFELCESSMMESNE